MKDAKIAKEESNALTISFFLEKGSYATVAIAYLLDSLDSFSKQFV